MATSTADASASTDYRCGFCAVPATADAPLTAFRVASFRCPMAAGKGAGRVGMRRKRQPAGRRLACATCWPLVRQRNPFALASRSVAADTATGAFSTPLAVYAAAYSALLTAVESPADV